MGITDIAAFFDPYDTLHSPWKLRDWNSFVSFNRDGTWCYLKPYWKKKISRSASGGPDTACFNPRQTHLTPLFKITILLHFYPDK